MKNTYVKPELFYESFVLSQHIAGCSLTLTTDKDVNNCTASGYANLGGFGEDYYSALFVQGNESCLGKVYEYCITNGSASVVISTS